ncbi:MAG TPA: hypothetical protein VFJ45_08875 [bacterium]|nr:hypothetical protein [bacterium]
MVTEALEIRMARLEDAYEQINERLAGVERELSAFRAEFKAELKAEIGSLRPDSADIRKQLQTRFYWTLTLILGAVLFPVLRDLALTR